ARVVQYLGQRMIIPGLGPTPGSVYFTLFTSMFMHGGFMHLGGNMLFLWIFGDNIEDRLGHVKYLIFYLLCGVIASLAHVFTTGVFATSENALLVPSLGASGAISGVLGAYILLHPKRRIMVINFWFLTTMPAYLVIGIWFAFQLINGLGMLGVGSQQGGVAYAAHIGGFLAGLVLIKFFDPGKRQTEYYRHNTDMNIQSTPRVEMNLFPLETFAYQFPGSEIKINFEITEFTAICPFSDFPDFATIRIEYVPNERCVELKSLKLYINSFRNVKIFHEHVINIILEDFVAACDPISVNIEGDFHVRGNIKTIVRAAYAR